MKKATILINVTLAGLILVGMEAAMAAMQPEEPYDDAVVLAQSEEPGVGGETNRITLAEVADLKYPILLISEVVADGSNVVSQSAVVGDHIIVKLQPGKVQTDLETLNTQLGGTIRSALYVPRTFLVAFTNATLDTIDNSVEAYSAATNVVLYAEPDGIMHLNSFTPNDPSFTNLWGLHNTGQSGGTADSDIDAPEAWDTSRGTGVVVAVLDSGVDYTHPDLAANMWSNVNEIAGNGIDDDGNGFVDDIYGYDFYNNDSNPMDDNNHGTHCAGTIAAFGNNSTGVVGVAWQAKIMALKLASAGGGNTAAGLISDMVDSLEYVISMKQQGVNVRITSVSLSGSNASSILRDSILAAATNGILVVAAAGNDFNNFDDTGYTFNRTYPACYDADNVISVAAMDRYGNMPIFSNRGAVDVDLSAPGAGILSTIRNNAYDTWDGTSMATPHVAGVAALLFSHDPTLSIARARRLLLDGASPLTAPTDGWTVTDGCVNAARSLELLDAVAAPTFDPAPGFFDTNTVQVTMTSETPSAVIYFTTNGIDPDVTSSLYTGTVTVAMGTTLKARGYATGMPDSPVESGCYLWPRQRLLRWGLSLNPGWTTNGLWAYGVPTGVGGDPTSGFTGTNVYGYNLSGNYEQGITRTLTTPAIDCSTLTATQLRFHRRLYLEDGESSIQISTNGVSWVDVWKIRAGERSFLAPNLVLRDTGWNPIVHDITNVADGQSSVYLRWVMGPIESSGVTRGGWNIDDIEIWSSKDPSTISYSEPSWAF